MFTENNITPDTDREFARGEIAALWLNCKKDLDKLQQLVSLDGMSSPVSGGSRRSS